MGGFWIDVLRVAAARAGRGDVLGVACVHIQVIMDSASDDSWVNM